VLARVGLMLDELVTNIVLHGYGEEVGTIEVEATVSGRELAVTLVDHAFAYDPLQAPETDTTLDIEHRSIGGLGVQFVRQMADALSYRRIERDGRAANALTLVKRF
jgi:serine/threonine-protein kinase RsbW